MENTQDCFAQQIFASAGLSVVDEGSSQPLSPPKKRRYQRKSKTHVDEAETEEVELLTARMLARKAR